MNSPFDIYVSQLQSLFEQMIGAPRMRLDNLNILTKEAGCYAFIEGDVYLYVGIAKNIRRRIRNHLAGRANQSAFAFRLARSEIRAPVTYRPAGGRRDLMTRPEFVEAMRSVTSRIRQMSIQAVTIEDPSLLYLYEFYAAKRLNTPHNSFNLH